jgi:hypothetical protein
MMANEVSLSLPIAEFFSAPLVYVNQPTCQYIKATEGPGDWLGKGSSRNLPYTTYSFLCSTFWHMTTNLIA